MCPDRSGLVAALLATSIALTARAGTPADIGNAPERALSAKEASSLISSLIRDCLKQGWVKRYQAAHRGQAPDVRLAVTVPRLDSALESLDLLATVQRQLVRQGGVKVRLDAGGHPRMYALTPGAQVKSSSGFFESTANGAFSFEAKVSFTDARRAGRQVRTYALEMSLVDIAHLSRLWVANRRFERKPAGLPVNSLRPASAGCSGGPAWMRLRPCVHDGWAYAVGSVWPAEDPTAAMWLSDPISAAEVELFDAYAASREGNVQLTVKVVEAPDHFACDGKIHVLVRSSQPELVRAGLPRCDRTAVRSRSPLAKDCPGWTRTVAWRERGKLWGVAWAATGTVPVPDLTSQAERNLMAGGGSVHMLERNAEARRRFSSRHSAPRVRRLKNKAATELTCGGQVFVRVAAEPE